MPDSDRRHGLFPALLKHWRGQRGLSQLDLAIASDVSARHLSFLETGRSTPSAQMVLRLGAALGVPLRHVNAMLSAAGHPPVYPEAGDDLPPVVVEALDLLKTHHEPYPLVLMDRAYNVRDLNRGALAVFAAILGLALPAELEPAEIAALQLNLARASFDPEGAQPYLVNFAELGRALLWRIQREVLSDPEDGQLRALLDEILAMPTVDPDWREVDLAVRSDPTVVVHLRRGPLELRFLTMITAFQAPQNIAVEELRVETWLPYDEATRLACASLAGQ